MVVNLSPGTLIQVDIQVTAEDDQPGGIILDDFLPAPFQAHDCRSRSDTSEAAPVPVPVVVPAWKKRSSRRRNSRHRRQDPCHRREAVLSTRTHGGRTTRPCGRAVKAVLGRALGSDGPSAADDDACRAACGTACPVQLHDARLRNERAKQKRTSAPAFSGLRSTRTRCNARRPMLWLER